ncbi:hypothetical protein FNV43_RR02403 [Rhamnella rubrinervis]|uniref:Uncharacterized protein n=1 Tax=Rhamnella rubrinervis TaxID=2594499 RepID=A0A8K0MTP3_9ROSA|nr:hypothetical protein FNV43_RR02403 [Rhamnella rubrinervis]
MSALNKTNKRVWFADPIATFLGPIDAFDAPIAFDIEIGDRSNGARRIKCVNRIGERCNWIRKPSPLLCLPRLREPMFHAWWFRHSKDTALSGRPFLILLWRLDHQYHMCVRD